ncbi:hypothetical protein DITRI_Ditri02bG0009300 [Diplodiscus trichospermus]
MEGEPDRISNLNDRLLEHILSFLPIKNAVQTSVLSKRWKHLWISRLYVSLDENEFPYDYSITGIDRQSRRRKFINFVDKVLLHRGHDKPIIKKLQLSCGEDIGASEFFRWFQAVSRDGLEELELNFAGFCEKSLNYAVRCNSLVTLKLNFGAFSAYRFPKFFDFPNLKIMQLNGFILPKNFTYQVMKCKNLEQLLLGYFMFDFSFFQVGDGNGNDHQEILPNLRIAQFDCPNVYRGSDTARLFMKRLITVLSNAEVLSIALSAIEYLYIEPNIPEQLPQFNNLKRLNIFLQAYLVEVLNYLFQKAPNLEYFHIELHQPYNYGTHNKLTLERLRSNCSRACLKEIQLSHLNTENNSHLELVQLFFESSGFLEKMIIELDEIAAMNPFLHCQKLIQLPRLSKFFVLDVKWGNGGHIFTICD